MDKSFDEVNQFVMTGNFPQTQTNNPAPQTTPSPMQATPTQQFTPNTMQTASAPSTPPWEEETPFTQDFNANPPGVPNTTPQMDRPTRYY